MRDAGDNVHVGGALSNAGFLDHVHGGGAGADDDDVRLGNFAGLADVVVMFDWEGGSLLTWQFGDVGKNVVSATNQISATDIEFGGQAKAYVQTRTPLA